MINTEAMQARIARLLTNTLAGVACTIVQNGGSPQLSTVAVFDNALFQNVDNRQNPTTVVGLKQVAYVPGNIAWAPGVGARLQYTVGSTTFDRRVSSVTVCAPTGVVLYYTLGLE